MWCCRDTDLKQKVTVYSSTVPLKIIQQQPIVLCDVSNFLI
jgi:hypothetical protein